MNITAVWRSIRQKTDPRIRLIIIALMVGIGFWVLDAALGSPLYNGVSFTDLLIYEVPTHHLYSRIFVMVILLIYGFSLGQHLYRSESQEREYGMLLNTTKDAVLIHDMSGRFLEANTAATQKLGYSHDEFLDMRITDINPIEDTEFISQRIERIMTLGSERFETLLRTRDNDILEVDITTTYISGQRGKFIAFIQDLTERKTYTRRLRESENRFKILVHSIRDIVYTLDREHRHTGVYGDWVKEAGMHKEDFLGKTARDIFGPEAAAVHEDAVNRALQNEYVVYEWSVPGDNGSSYYQTSVAPLFDDKEIIGVIGVGRDITEQKQAEIKLRKTNERLNLAVASSGIGLWDWNLETNEITISEEWAGMLGYNLEELLPTTIQTWDSLAHPEDLRQSNQRIKEYLDGKSDFYECEARMQHKNGHWVWIRDRGKVVEWSKDGKPLRMIGTHLDITHVKNREQQKDERLRRMQEVLNPIEQGVLIVDEQDIITYLNKSAARLFRADQKRITNKPVTELFTLQDWQIVHDTAQREWENTKSSELVEIPISSIDGMDTLKNITLQIFPLENDSGESGYFIKLDASDPIVADTQLATSSDDKEIITLCSKCHKVQTNPEEWSNIGTYLHQIWDILVSHGLCPDCLEDMVHSGIPKGQQKKNS